jgi:hypothetical protein
MKLSGINLLVPAVLVFGWLTAQVAIAAEQLTWTNPDGKEVSGEFLRMDTLNKSIVIRTELGREIVVPLASLSFESHLQALKLAKPEAFNKDVVKAPEAVQPVELTTPTPVGSVTDSPFGEDPTIDEFLRISIGEWKRGNNFIVWHMMPPRMQQDIQELIKKNTQGIGPTGLAQARQMVSTMASLAAKKRDWIVQSPLVALYPIQADSPKADQQWPIMVGMLEKLSDKSLWDSDNFQAESLIPWLVNSSEMLAYVREMSGELNDVTTNVLSQSADRAEVEVKIGSMEPVIYQFQKVGNIWIVPEIMNEMRAKLDQQLKGDDSGQMFSMLGAVLGVAGTMLSQLDKAKTLEEFNQNVNNPLLVQFLSRLPKTRSDRGPLKGLPPLPGIPEIIFGLPGGGF